MLYVTTRESKDVFTAHRALCENRSPDGGFYRPFRDPSFSLEEMEGLLELPFWNCVTEILNCLFNTKLTAWELEFAAGKCPLSVKSLGYRVVGVEFRQNSSGSYENLVKSILTLLLGQETANPGNWCRIAIRIALLFGTIGELRRTGVEQTVDITVVSGDFSRPISAWYAKKWGLPIGNILCCCNENNGLWELFRHGQMRTDGVSVPTAVPEADVALPENLERLIFECGGGEAVGSYLEACRKGKSYCCTEAMLTKLRQGMAVSVVSSQRVRDTISGVYRTRGCMLSPGGALAYAGLMDHRAQTGQTGTSIVWTENGL